MNSFGHSFRITLFGESHGPAIGVTIDGMPAGIPFSEQDLAPDLARRRSTGTAGTTPRREPDLPEIVSGIYNGHTDGTPLTQAQANSMRFLVASAVPKLDPDAVSVSAKFLTENRDQAMDLLHDALVNPIFDQPSVDRVREQVLSNLRSDAKDPSAIATNLERRLAYARPQPGNDF